MAPEEVTDLKLKPNLGWTIVSLRLAALTYLTIGLVTLSYMSVPLLRPHSIHYLHDSNYLFFLITAALTVFIASMTEIIIRGLRQKKQLAYTAAILVSTMYLPTIFLPIAAVALAGLLTADVRKEYLK